MSNTDLNKAVCCQRTVCLILFMLVLLALQACATFSSNKISEQQLQTQINKQLPLKKRLLFAGLKVPRFELKLLGGSPNVTIDVDFEVDILDYPLAKSQAMIKGDLVFDVERQALFLRRAQLYQLDVSAIPNVYQQQAFDGLGQLLQGFFKREPVYQLDKQKLRLKQIQVFRGYVLLQR